jgi:WD40 repeat protein
VIFGPDGNLYVSDRFSGRVLQYDGRTGAFVRTLIQDFRLGGFISFAFGPDSNVYASMFNCCAAQRIRRYNGTTGAFIDSLGEGLPSVDAAYAGITFGTDGMLYTSRLELIPGSIANRIERFDPTTGAFVDLLVAPGSGGLINARDLSFGPDGNLYVVSQNSNEVLRFSALTGAFVDVFASGGLFAPSSLVFVPVPEAGTWAMFCGGLVALAFIARRRRGGP